MLVLVLIFSALLYILVVDLVTRAKYARLTGENDALLAAMDNHMVLTLAKVEQSLQDDLDEAELAEEEEVDPGAGGDASAGATLDPTAAAGGGGLGEQAQPSDSSQDAWFLPTAFADGDITTYVWVEDENRKFNITSLLSPDEEFARDSHDRLVRLLNELREDTEYDLSSSHANTIADAIRDWLQGYNRNDSMPRPPLKSDGDLGSQQSIPLHLDELLLLRGVTEDLFYDQVLDRRVVPGLESVLTVYTSWKRDPGEPGQQTGNLGSAVAGDESDDSQAAATSSTDEEEGESQPEGEGIHININTAPRAVLRGLMSEAELSNSVLDAILRYRNEVLDEEDGDFASDALNDQITDIVEEEVESKQIFESLDDLEQVEEFANLPDPDVKNKFLNLLTTKSDVFSIHLTAIYKFAEEPKSFAISRRRSLMVRFSGAEASSLHPLIFLERRNGLRVMGVDFPEDEDLHQLELRMEEMDDFSREERKWNPFFLDFYEPAQR